MEGEPASDKDKLLLIRSPHLVLDGAQLLAAASRARADRPSACPQGRDHVAAAVRAAPWPSAPAAGYAPVPEELVRPPDRFIAGEESALASWVESGPVPPVVPPGQGRRRCASGARRALVHNAETLAHVAMIARTGPDAFRARGLAEDPGTSPGHDRRARSSTPASSRSTGARPSSTSPTGPRRCGPPQALLVGGYGGAWVGPEHFATPYASLSLRAIGRHRRRRHRGRARVRMPAASWSRRGSRTTWPGQSAGQCGPCVYGLPAIADDLTRLARGQVDAGLLAPARAPARRGRRPRRLPPPRRRGQPGAQRAAGLRGRCRGARGRARRARTGSRADAAALPRAADGRPDVIRILIDPVACDAYGYCAELLPEAITLDEWGYPMVDGKPLPPELVDVARRAARDCPRRAITLRERKSGH